MFFGETAKVDDCVAHSAKSGVDADTSTGGNVFEVALAVMTEDDHSALLGRKHLDEFAHIAAGLLAHDALLNVVIVEF